MKSLIIRDLSFLETEISNNASVHGATGKFDFDFWDIDWDCFDDYKKYSPKDKCKKVYTDTVYYKGKGYEYVSATAYVCIY